MSPIALFMMLVRLGFCQDQMVIPQPNGTNVHIATCAVIEPRDMTDDEMRQRSEKPPVNG